VGTEISVVSSVGYWPDWCNAKAHFTLFASPLFNHRSNPVGQSLLPSFIRFLGLPSGICQERHKPVRSFIEHGERIKFALAAKKIIKVCRNRSDRKVKETGAATFIRDGGA
jgi:hypothetical protein